MEITRYASKELVDKLKAREIGIEEFIKRCYIYPAKVPLIPCHWLADNVEHDKQVKITIEEE
jgi:hypothetical protein